jgi:hypothetical protein
MGRKNQVSIGKITFLNDEKALTNAKQLIIRELINQIIRNHQNSIINDKSTGY